MTVHVSIPVSENGFLELPNKSGGFRECSMRFLLTPIFTTSWGKSKCFEFAFLKKRKKNKKTDKSRDSFLEIAYRNRSFETKLWHPTIVWFLRQSKRDSRASVLMKVKVLWISGSQKQNQTKKYVNDSFFEIAYRNWIFETMLWQLFCYWVVPTKI